MPRVSTTDSHYFSRSFKRGLNRTPYIFGGAVLGIAAVGATAGLAGLTLPAYAELMAAAAGALASSRYA